MCTFTNKSEIKILTVKLADEKEQQTLQWHRYEDNESLWEKEKHSLQEALAKAHKTIEAKMQEMQTYIAMNTNEDKNVDALMMKIGEYE